MAPANGDPPTDKAAGPPTDRLRQEWLVQSELILQSIDRDAREKGKDLPDPTMEDLNRPVLGVPSVHLLAFFLEVCATELPAGRLVPGAGSSHSTHFVSNEHWWVVKRATKELKERQPSPTRGWKLLGAPIRDFLGKCKVECATRTLNDYRLFTALTNPTRSKVHLALFLLRAIQLASQSDDERALAEFFHFLFHTVLSPQLSVMVYLRLFSLMPTQKQEFLESKRIIAKLKKAKEDYPFSLQEESSMILVKRCFYNSAHPPACAINAFKCYHNFTVEPDGPFKDIYLWATETLTPAAPASVVKIVMLNGIEYLEYAKDIEFPEDAPEPDPVPKKIEDLKKEPESRKGRWATHFTRLYCRVVAKLSKEKTAVEEKQGAVTKAIDAARQAFEVLARDLTSASYSKLTEAMSALHVMFTPKRDRETEPQESPPTKRRRVMGSQGQNELPIPTQHFTVTEDEFAVSLATACTELRDLMPPKFEGPDAVPKPSPAQCGFQHKLDDFRFVRFLGAGTFGSAYEMVSAHVPSLRVVLKRVDGKSFEADIASRELTSMTKVAQHGEDHCVTCYGFMPLPNKVANGYSFGILMELCHCDLMQAIDAIRQKKPREKAFTVCVASIQILKSVQAMKEANITHRDIKPDNLFLDRNGDIKTGDFGLARVMTSSGTPFRSVNPYWAPEAATGSGYEKADLFSAGVVVYNMMTDDLPDPKWHKKFTKFNGKSQMQELRQELGDLFGLTGIGGEHGQKISESFVNLCLNMIHPDTEQRYSVEKALEELHKIQELLVLSGQGDGLDE